MISQSTLAAASRVAERTGCRATSSVVNQSQSPAFKGLDSDPKSDDPLAVPATVTSVVQAQEPLI
jgi:hypothetical protein